MRRILNRAYTLFSAVNLSIIFKFTKHVMYFCIKYLEKVLIRLCSFYIRRNKFRMVMAGPNVRAGPSLSPCCCSHRLLVNQWTGVCTRSVFDLNVDKSLYAESPNPSSPFPGSLQVPFGLVFSSQHRASQTYSPWWV